jgi:MFS family permease
MSERKGVIARVGAAQLLGWAASFYLPAIVAGPIARDLGLRPSTVFAAFSAGLLVAAVLGPWAGRWVDARGGRPVLMGSNLCFAAGLILMGVAQSFPALLGAWVLMGVGMATGLYEAAFAAVVKLYGREARGVIVGVTLLGGFASTLSWPLTTALDAHWGWRVSCFAWAAIELLIALPLHWSLPKEGVVVHSAVATFSGDLDVLPAEVPTSTSVLLSIVFAVTLFISTAMAAHLPALLLSSHVELATAVVVASLVGPAQVMGRLLELGPLGRLHPLISARWAGALHPLGAVLFVFFGAPLAVVFGIVHGIGNGLMTIAKGTLPLVLFGARGYGERQGVLMVPARLAQSVAPWLFGLWVDQWGSGALWFSAAIGSVGLACLLALPKRATPAQSEMPA